MPCVPNTVAISTSAFHARRDGGEVARRHVQLRADQAVGQFLAQSAHGAHRDIPKDDDGTG